MHFQQVKCYMEACNGTADACKVKAQNANNLCEKSYCFVSTNLRIFKRLNKD